MNLFIVKTFTVRLMQLGIILLVFFGAKKTLEKIKNPTPCDCPKVYVIYNNKVKKAGLAGTVESCDKTIELRKSSYPRIINSQDIVYIEATRSFVRVFTNDGSSTFSMEHMKRFSAKLVNCKEFIKVESLMINRAYVEEVIEGDGNYIVRMHGGKRVPISGKVKRIIKKMTADFEKCS